MQTILAAAALAPIFSLASAARAADAPAIETAADRDAAAGLEWKEKLGLSAEQETKFMAALKATDAELEPLRAQLRGEMRRVQSQLTENAPDKDVADTLQRLVRLRRTIAQRDEQFVAGAASFLSATQRAKLLVWRSLNSCRGRTAENMSGDELQEASSGEEVEPE